VSKPLGVIAVSVSALAVTMLVAVGYFSQRGVGENGAGFNYRDKFYGMSGAEVRSDRLGPFLDRDIGFHDASTDVRAIVDVAPDTAVAARVRDVGGTPAEDGVAWLLMSPVADLAANPWADPDLVVAVYPNQ
jgi:hypothetical protein